jgi:hypothetical protein
LVAAFVWVAAREPASAPEPCVVEAATFADALELARSHSRLVAVDFTSAAAPCSEVLRTETLCDPQVRAELADGFVHVEVDAQREPELFREVFGTPGFLASAVLDGAGDVLAERAGFANAFEHACWLAKARAGARAVADARELVALAEDDATAWRALGEARERAGSLRLAAAAYERSLASSGATAQEQSFACERLARFAVERGEVLVARTWLERAGVDAPRLLAPRLDITAALLRITERAPKLATEPLERALAAPLAPDERATALFALADARRDAGDGVGALAALGRLLDSGVEASTRARARDAIVALRTNAHGHVH